MLKALRMTALATLLMVPQAFAGSPCDNGAAPAAAAAPVPAAPAQARVPQATRSFSYAPPMGEVNSVTAIPGYTRRIIPTYGMRSAASKAYGNY